MKRNIIAISLGIAGILSCAAMPLTPQAALQRVESTGTRAASPLFIHAWEDSEGNPTLYLYTFSGSDGFLLLSADDAAAPLLGYSPINSFPTENQPASVKSWLAYYSDQIVSLRNSTFYSVYPTFYPATRAGQPAIAPMLSTTWDQVSPYNDLCPTLEGRRCVTGCVATAMAQVMKYWEYPSVGKGSVTYSPISLEEELSLDFSTVEFDWANMQNAYSRGGASASATSRRAVAQLMQACGYSVKMRYTTHESGAYDRDIPNALTSYFGYDQGLQRVDRSGFQTQEEWNQLIYNDLANVGPVILNGQSSTGAHCFICDGYDGAGYYHINWGWGGLSDGYFLLNELTPNDIGTGGHYGGYNIGQTAIIGITPPVGRISDAEISIENAVEYGNVKGWGYTYRVDDFSNIRLSVDIRIAGGHISSPLYVTVNETDPDSKKNLATVFDSKFDQPLNASDGLTTCQTRVSLDSFDPSKLYTLTVAYDLKGQRTTIGSIRMAASAGLDDMTSEEVLEVEIYDLSGILVARGCAATQLPDVAPGVYIVKSIGIDGSVRVSKQLLQ